eukprot:TRINITY_DN26063_c0_g1_i1.p1 TRINITY_DN26063_c0_g1~~TRINITY_DN26063_c0_g1_i1.p1  ORF type:complete len:140 (+),score=36.13 TRINITY_DN26063_c0_g1_i1:46-465(+)
MLLLFVSSFLLLQGSLGGRTITELRTKTGTASGAGCDCKMEVAINTPQGLCVTNELGNSHINDFQNGHLDSFSGAQLGECQDFEPGDSNSGWELVFFHTGSDGWIGDYAEVVMSDNSFVRCGINGEVIDGVDNMHIYCD